MEIEVKVKMGRSKKAKPKILMIDDEVYLQHQPINVRELINSKLESGFAELENATIRVFESGRIVIDVRDYGI